MDIWKQAPYYRTWFALKRSSMWSKVLRMQYSTHSKDTQHEVHKGNAPGLHCLQLYPQICIQIITTKSIGCSCTAVRGGVVLWFRELLPCLLLLALL